MRLGCWIVVAVARVVLLWGAAHVGAHAADPPVTRLKVQLPWTHSSQFAGYYAAQMRNHFLREGLEVELIEGGHDISPLEALRQGKADIGISGLKSALEQVRLTPPVTHIAQIIQGPSVVIMCRVSAGVLTPQDLAGKKVGVFKIGDDRTVVRAVLKNLSIPEGAVELVDQRPHGRDLIENKVACATGLVFSEYLELLDAGIAGNDLMVIEPNKLGVPTLLDGAYVESARLRDADFRAALVKFLRASRKGWQETRISPTLSLEYLRAWNPSFNKDFELRSLEQLLPLIPTEPKKFGLLDLATFEQEASRYPAVRDPLERGGTKVWTHSIWNGLQESDGDRKLLSVSTRHYLGELSQSVFFKLFVFLGVFTYALSGVLEAIRREYDLWGRLMLAFISGIGGGTVRDLIIGGERMPFYYVLDFRYPLGIILVVFAASFVVARKAGVVESEAFKKIKMYSDIVGFAGLAVAGATYAVLADTPWYWVAPLAALTCAGGGALRDIVINQEPHTFKGIIYEEVALLGGVFILLGLLIANLFEHHHEPVTVVMAGAFLLVIAVRILIEKYGITYPRSLGGSGAAHH